MSVTHWYSDFCSLDSIGVCVCVHTHMPHICFCTQISYFFHPLNFHPGGRGTLFMFLLVVTGDRGFSHRNQNPPSPVLFPCDSKKMFHLQTAPQSILGSCRTSSRSGGLSVCHGSPSENSAHSRGGVSLTPYFPACLDQMNWERQVFGKSPL